jgi:hypothetical protein
MLPLKVPTTDFHPAGRTVAVDSGTVPSYGGAGSAAAGPGFVLR